MYLVINDNVVLCRHVISNVVINNQPQKSIQQSQINLLVHLLVVWFHHNIALSFRCLPDILQVVDSWKQKQMQFEYYAFSWGKKEKKYSCLQTASRDFSNLGTIYMSAMVEVLCQLASPTEETDASCQLHTINIGQGRHLWSSPMAQRHTLGWGDCTSPWTRFQPVKSISVINASYLSAVNCANSPLQPF